MSLRLLPVLSLIAVATVASSASAQHPYGHDAGMFESFHYDYYRNKMWPLPFRAADTRAVMGYFDVQRNNGWKLHNTVGASMFDPETNALTDSGRAHVKWVISRAPRNRRVLFVLQAKDRHATAARVESTQLAVSEMVPVGPLPSIYLTDQDAPGSSGAYQTAIHRAMTNSVPSPRLGTDPNTATSLSN